MLTACTSCGGEAEATSWCVDCGEALCRGCVEAHKRVKVTRSHHILDQLPADVPRSDSAPTGIYCPLHREEVLQLYCYTCDVRTCRDCQLMDHRAHSFQYVHEAYQSIRKQMYGLLVPVDKHTEKAMQSIMLMSSRPSTPPRRRS
ncbi:transcription intermediary factor 1-beta [Gadus morhua]|uniref:transcription intermediary factor 1-beta n=1 Tax=Gadus morhua TaxID=8049 RepID=UPI0011B42306|nr:transcription intermediary factor 1-beta-like [Gadus morhua]